MMMLYLPVIEAIAQQPREKDAILFTKKQSKEILFCWWENGAYYEAPYKCLPSSFQDPDLLIQKLEAALFDPFYRKKEEWMLFHTGSSLINKEKLKWKVERLSYEDEEALELLKAVCSIEERQIAAIQIYEECLFGVWQEGVLLGVCGVQKLWNAYDVAVLVHPDYRQKGIASALLETMRHWIKKQNGIYMYRLEKENKTSYACAKAFGFEKKITMIRYEKDR